LMAAILAPAMTALEGSVIRPESEAFVDWAGRAAGKETKKSNANAGTRRMDSPHGKLRVAKVLLPRRMVNETKVLRSFMG